MGFVSPKREEETVQKMLETQQYRGPDDHGVFVTKTAVDYLHFGHNRLSIQDLSSHGHQPFISSCENYVIVYNGEVYNFNEIRVELDALGYSFISKSDTEVILYAYKEWGIECLEKFIGMFAFAIFDKPENKIVLVRDRAGIKPLYYYTAENCFMFASELKSFHRHPSFQKKLNREILPYFFQYGYIPAPHSIFKKTCKLEPGHYLEYDLLTNRYEIHKYWSVNDYFAQEKLDADEKEILDDLENLLNDAAELRMISDVPVGVFLSGGIDSSLVTALLSKKSGRKLHTFTIGFEDTRYNEAAHAKTVAEYLGTEHTEYYLSKEDMLENVEKLPFYYDEPFGANSALAVMKLSELARKNVTVALSADGGDEAFCGYSKYFFLEKFSKLFAKRFQKSMLEAALGMLDEKRVEALNNLLPSKRRQSNIKEKYGKFKRAVESKTLDEMFANASSLVDSKDVNALLKLESGKPLYERPLINESRALMDEMMRIDYQTFMSDEVLTKVDRATMSVSLEGREPFLDHRIIEFMAKVPVALKYKHGQGKYLPRQILYRHVPREIIDRPKAGFQVPLLEWLQNDLRYLVEEYLDKNRIDTEIFDPYEVEKIKDELLSGSYTNVNTVWFVMMYEMWREKWF